MVNIFEELQEEFPPFNDFMKDKFEKHNTKLVGGGTVYHLAGAKERMIFLEHKATKETDKESQPAMLNELLDPRKLTASYLHSQDGSHLRKNSIYSLDKSMLGKKKLMMMPRDHVQTGLMSCSVLE